MAFRQAVKVVADALDTNLQTKLDALTVVSGETAPTIVRFLDDYGDSALASADYPAVVTYTPPVPIDAEFRQMEKGDWEVPVIVDYIDRDADTEKARQRSAYAIEGIWQVLNDLDAAQTAEGNWRLWLLLSGQPQMGVFDAIERYGARLTFLCRMRGTDVT